MIKAVFNGGLGNQMFQYAYIYAQIKENNLSSDVYAVMTDSEFEDKRFFALNSLSCTLNLNSVHVNDAKIGFKIRIIIKKILMKILLKFKASDKTIIRELNKYGICYSPSIFKYYPELKLKNNGLVQGYFQTWKYFDKYRDDLIKEFAISKEINNECKRMLEKISSTNSVCVHIRRGDYINSPFSKNVQICNFDYYKRGMEYIASKVENPTFYIFSNSHEDHEWIKQNYKFDYNVEHVDLNNCDYEDLKLMSSCNNFILSNSTFSFWAQYLSKNESKHVVVPSKWFLGDNDDASDIYMPSWKIIEVGGKNENINYN